jgi:hypothetical protein
MLHCIKKRKIISLIIYGGILGTVLFFQLNYLVPHGDLFVYADHPGMFLLVHRTITDYSVLGWFPDWYAGYPELAYFPPGFFIMGKVIHSLLLGTAEPMFVYKILLIISNCLLFLIPFLVLRGFGFASIQAFWSALLIMIFFYGSFGGYPGMRIGGNTVMSLALAPVPLLFLIKAIKSGKGMLLHYYLMAGLTWACITLIHPYHSIITAGGILAVGISVLLTNKLQFFIFVGRIIISICVFFCITAFWIVPGLIRHEYSTSFQFFSHDWRSIIVMMIVDGWRILLVTLIWFFLFFYYLKRKKVSFERYVLTLLPFSIAIVIFINELLVKSGLITLFNSYQLATDLMYSLVWLAPLGVLELISILFEKTNNKYYRSIAWSSFILIFSFLTQQQVVKLINDQYIPNKKISQFTFNRLTDIYGINRLWSWLRHDNNEGRVLFTSSTFYLFERDMSHRRRFDQYHDASGILSLTPLYTDRQIIGGTWPHPSKISRYFSYGDPAIACVNNFTNYACDDRTLFGIPLEELKEESLLQSLNLLDVSRIVIGNWECNMLNWFKNAGHFNCIGTIGSFRIFEPNDYIPDVFENTYRTTDVAIVDEQPGYYRLKIKSPEANATILFKICYHPCWKIRNKNVKIILSSGNTGLMQLNIPAGTDDEIELYTMNPLEKFCVALSSFAFLGCVTAFFILQLIHRKES